MTAGSTSIPSTAGIAGSSTSTTSPRSARRIRRCSRRATARSSNSSRGRRRRAAHRPPRWPGRSGRLSRAATRRGRRPGLGREDPAPRRARSATGRSAARSATSSSATPARCSSIPRAEGALTACHATFSRRGADVRGGGRARRRSSWPARASVTSSSGSPGSTRGTVREELAQALATLPVYRTYVEPDARRVDPADRAAVEAAGLASRSTRAPPRGGASAPPAEFVIRFQQTSPAIAAKGVEDTAFYRHLRLISLNEVGGDPDRFTLDVDAFHAGNLERARRFPSTLLATQTHDTKRSGDVRARIGALSAHADEWCEQVERWRVLNAPFGPARHPTRRGVLLYQTLIGSWPIDAEPPRALPREGAPRGQAQHELARARTSRGRARSSTSRAPSSSTTASSRSSNRSASASARAVSAARSASSS